MPYMLAERFLNKVDRRGMNECWPWLGSTKRSHEAVYGVIWQDGQNRSAHRLALELSGKPAPDDAAQADHLCENTLCMNPRHLQWATPRENTLRSSANPCAINARKTHCKRGHELAGANLRINPKGERICRACERTRALGYYYARRGMS